MFKLPQNSSDYSVNWKNLLTKIRDVDNSSKNEVGKPGPRRKKKKFHVEKRGEIIKNGTESSQKASTSNIEENFTPISSKNRPNLVVENFQTLNNDVFTDPA